MQTSLFKGIITDNRSWSMCWKSEDIYMPLLKYIYETSHMKFGEILTPPETSNALFRVGNSIIKIFIPPETNLKDGGEYIAELEGIKFCKNLGINTPDILCHGIINDNLYSFPYIIMTYIDGIEADTAFLEYSKSEKIEYVLKLKEIMNTISIPTNINIRRYDEPYFINHVNWNSMSESFREDRKNYLANANIPEPVFNQGDFGGCNVIIDKQGRLNLIDFASSLIAPYYYEMPDWDEHYLMEAYYGNYKNDEFYEISLMATLIYHFSPFFSINSFAEEAGINIADISSVSMLKNIIIKSLNSKK